MGIGLPGIPVHFTDPEHEQCLNKQEQTIADSNQKIKDGEL